ncbi:hypothetical protein KAM380_083750 [Aeromonas caviae]|nr:hypothetical protein KAM380_083750 [Aeromonas caviae]
MLRSALALLLAIALPAQALADNGKPLRIGITLHPYYSYVSNIVGDKAEVVPLIPAGFNPHCLRATGRGHQAHRYPGRGGTERRRP